MVQNGLATALIVLLFLLILPLVVQLFALGSLTAPLSVLLLLAPALAVGIISFRVQRVLEPAFSDTFIGESGRPEGFSIGVEHDEMVDVETPAHPPGIPPAIAHRPVASRRRPDDPLVAAAIEHLEEHDELWLLLEERLARLHETDHPAPHRHEADAAGDGN